MAKKRCSLNNIVDLFSGAGGLSLGAARAGFLVRGAVDLDPEAMSAHELNFPTAGHLKADVSRLTGHKLKTSFGLRNGDLAGIIGGPPCQGFSRIGRNEKDDARNELFVEFFRVVAEALPKFFLAENVPGIFSDKNSKFRDRSFSYVEDKYVILPPAMISADDFGAPTRRLRAFFIGYLPEEMEPLSAEGFNCPADAETVSVREAIRGLPIKINPDWQKEDQGWRIVRVHGDGYYASRLHGHVPRGVGNSVALKRLKNESRASGSLGTVHSKKVAQRYAKIKPGKRDLVSKSYRLDANGLCPTLRAGTGFDRGRFQAVRPLHPAENRVITPREAARLQGFPDWFQFSPTKWHSFRQIGSSVSPILAERLMTVIQTALGDGK